MVSNPSSSAFATHLRPTKMKIKQKFQYMSDEARLRTCRLLEFGA